MTDPYLVLGVSRDADDAVIRKAYRALAKTCHPDLSGNNTRRSKELFQNITAAYDTLRSVDRRKEYQEHERGALGTEPGLANGGFGKPRYHSARQAWTPTKKPVRPADRASGTPKRVLVFAILFSIVALLFICRRPATSGFEVSSRSSVTSAYGGQINSKGAFATRELIYCQGDQAFRFSVAKGENDLGISINGSEFVSASTKAAGDLTILRVESASQGRVDFGFFKGDKDGVVVTIVESGRARTINANCSSPVF